jgi:hypothetical protein
MQSSTENGGFNLARDNMTLKFGHVTMAHCHLEKSIEAALRLKAVAYGTS